MKQNFEQTKGLAIATRRLRGLGYRVADVSNDSRHKGYSILGWKNGERRRIGVKSIYKDTDLRPRLSRNDKLFCDMMVVAMLRTGNIQIITW